VTIVTSNLATRSNQKEQSQPTSLVALAKILYGKPKPQYLNAIAIATNLAVADTGATSIFVMDGVDVENKDWQQNHSPSTSQMVGKSSQHMCVT
jgi:hypothetical protein